MFPSSKGFVNRSSGNHSRLLQNCWALLNPPEGSKKINVVRSGWLALAPSPRTAVLAGTDGSEWSTAEAIAAYERGNLLSGSIVNDARIARVYARMGRVDEAERILGLLQARPAGEPLTAAGAYAVLGRTDDAFRVPFRNLDDRRELGIFVNKDPPLQTLHADSRWALLLSRLNLAP